MGGIFSQEIPSEEEVMKIQDTLGLTPSQQLHHPRLRDVRLLSLDPRSPTDFISRTPIIVEKTPEMQAKKMKPSCVAVETSQEGPVIKDPRSPTRDFARTPINPCHASTVAVLRRNVKTGSCTEEPETRELESVVRELKPHLESSSQLSVVGSDPKPSGEAVSLSKNPASGDTLSVDENPVSGVITEQEPEVLLEKDLKQLGACIEAEEPNSVVDAEVASDARCEGIAMWKDNAGCKEIEASAVDNKFISKVKSIEESTPKLAALIPTKSDNRIRMKPKTLSLQSSVLRSPLSTMQNSPRKLTDRNKSLSNGSKTLHTHNKTLHTHNMALDKENVFH